MDGLNVRRLLFKNTAAQMAGYGISLAVGLVTTAILSRYLGVEGFGQFHYIFAFYSFFLTVNDFGVNTIVIREISRNPEKADQIVGGMLSFKLLLSVVSALLAWTFISWMGFPQPLREALFLYALILPLLALEFPTVIFHAVFRLENLALLGIFNRLAGFLLLVSAVGLGFGLKTIIACLLTAEALSAVMIWKMALKWVKPVFHVDVQLWLKVLRSSVILGVTGFFVMMVNRLDFLMLERMTDLSQVGLYSAAYRVTNLLEAFPLMVMGTVYPLMSKYAFEDPARLKKIYRQVTLTLTGLALPLGAGITCLAPWIVSALFGRDYREAAVALRVLVGSSVFIYAAITSGNLIIALGKEKICLGITAVGALCNTVLNFLWIPKMGYVGAALATTITYALMFIADILCAEQLIKKRMVQG